MKKFFQSKPGKVLAGVVLILLAAYLWLLTHPRQVKIGGGTYIGRNGERLKDF